jgi:two-component system chemotaxis response regulator CheB
MLVKLSSKADELVINLSSLPPVNWLRPAANTLFNSLADTGLTNLLGVIMTGMGRDGCEGLTNMKTKNKAHIIAESEESCAIYGMPKAVIDQGIADKIVSSTEITNEIINYVGVYRNGFESIH